MQKLVFFTILLLSSIAYGQQVPQYSQYNRNQYMVNPAAAGVYDFVDVTIGGRMQWLGFDNAPKTSYLYVTTPIGRPKVRYNPGIRTSAGPVRNPEIKTGKLKHAIGGAVIADQYGAFRTLSAQATYALHLPVARNYNLSFGVNAGLSNRAFLSENAHVLSAMNGSCTVDQTYSNFVSNQGAQNTLDIGAGLYFYSNNLFVGVSTNQLTRDLVQFGNIQTNFDPLIHFQGTAGYKFPISDNVTLMPSILVKYLNPAPISVEGTLQLEYKEWLWFGLSYRNTDALVGMAGLNISERFKVGYSYDFNVSRLNNYSSGGHELILGLMLGR